MGCEGCAEEVGCEGSEEVGCEDYKRGVEKEDCREVEMYVGNMYWWY